MLSQQSNSWRCSIAFARCWANKLRVSRAWLQPGERRVVMEHYARPITYRFPSMANVCTHVDSGLWEGAFARDTVSLQQRLRRGLKPPPTAPNQQRVLK